MKDIVLQQEHHLLSLTALSQHNTDQIQIQQQHTNYSHNHEHYHNDNNNIISHNGHSPQPNHDSRIITKSNNTTATELEDRGDADQGSDNEEGSDEELLISSLLSQSMDYISTSNSTHHRTRNNINIKSDNNQRIERPSNSNNINHNNNYTTTHSTTRKTSVTNSNKSMERSLGITPQMESKMRRLLAIQSGEDYITTPNSKSNNNINNNNDNQKKNTATYNNNRNTIQFDCYNESDDLLALLNGTPISPIRRRYSNNNNSDNDTSQSRHYYNSNNSSSRRDQEDNRLYKLYDTSRLLSLVNQIEKDDLGDQY